MDSSGEIIKGPKVKEVLNSLILGGQLCKMEIARTPYCWLTLLSEVREEKNGTLLLIDRIPDFEKVLSASRRQDVLIEYLEKSGVPCSFLSRILRVDARGIWAELPERIQRIQRRRYFRLRAPAGTEIFFQAEPGKEEKGTVKDYSLSGVAFFVGRRVSLKTGDQLNNLKLRVPEGKDGLEVPIPLAVVRWVDPDFFQGQTLYALEFLELPEATRKEFNRHIFEKQRTLLRRVKN
jgi:c-di-GMP-binding flagellar brake protein YcgR